MSQEYSAFPNEDEVIIQDGLEYLVTDITNMPTNSEDSEFKHIYVI